MARSLFVALIALSASFPALAASNRGEVLIYPTALKSGANLLAGASWRKPLEKHAPHAVATFSRGGPLDAEARAMTLSNDHPEFAYWATMAQGIKTGRKYFFGTWAKIKSANLLCWVHGISTVNMKDAGFRVYNFSGGNPCLDLYLDEDVKARLSGDPDRWRLIARTFTPKESFLGGVVSMEIGFFKAAGDIVFAEPFLIDITGQPITLEVEIRGAKPVKKLVVVRTGTNDPEWQKEFSSPVTDFAETLPSRSEAFEGMDGDPMFGRALLVHYADGTQERVACPADGVFQRK